MLVFHKIGHIRNDNVYAGTFRTGEGHADIQRYHCVAVLEQGHVFANFANATKENYLEFAFEWSRLVSWLLSGRLHRLEIVHRQGQFAILGLLWLLVVGLFASRFWLGCALFGWLSE